MLPKLPERGRIVLLDLAFAHGHYYEQTTVPFIEGAGDRLAAWVDHHEHIGWARFGSDPRFVLIPKRQAPACPELITTDLVSRIGPVQHVLAHADFDGCITAATFFRGGNTPYPQADEDARAIDAPGCGFVCSPHGERLAQAIDGARNRGSPGDYCAFLVELTTTLITGEEPKPLGQQIDTLQGLQRQRLDVLSSWAQQATRPHPEVLLYRTSRKVSPSDRKALLRMLEQKATIGIVASPSRLTIGTFSDDHFNLSALPHLEGSQNFAWGTTTVEHIWPALLKQLKEL